MKSVQAGIRSSVERRALGPFDRVVMTHRLDRARPERLAQVSRPDRER